MDVWGGIDRGIGHSSAACSGVCRTLARARRSYSSSLGPHWCAARSYISDARGRMMLRTTSPCERSPKSRSYAAGFLSGIGDSKLCVHTFCAKLAPNSQKCCGKQ